MESNRLPSNCLARLASCLLCLSVTANAQAKDPPVVMRWDFGSEETTRLRSHGGVHRDVPGPRPPTYPDFEANNTAVKLGAEAAIKPTMQTMPELGRLAAGEVLVTLHESMPAHDRWLHDDETLPPETLRFPVDNFLLTRLPQRYDAWGIRETWKAPVLMRMAADVALPPGSHRFLLRVRGLSRLWIDGNLIAVSRPLTNSPNGEEPITPVASPPLPGLRGAEHRQQELFDQATVGSDGRCRIVLESIIGGKAFRAEPGELCVAVQTEDGKSFLLLQAAGNTGSPVMLVDSDVQSARDQQAAMLQDLDDQTRRAAAASQDGYWSVRHEAARQWASDHPSPHVPSTSHPSHPIDAFLSDKIERALAESAKNSSEEAERFHSQVLPILRDTCFRCHGEKENGGLRLDSHGSALKAGDSEMPAVVPGNPADSELIRRIRATDPDERMPPGDEGLNSSQIATLEAWVKADAIWPAVPVSAEDVQAPPPLADAAFLRRVYLDTVGVPPAEHEVRDFLSDEAADKRLRVVDQLLDDARWADHWTSYWQDVLAENPTLINPSLNTTGPFRWFLYDSFRDNKPMDRLVTELILLRGSPHEGGSAGFGIAADNDAPFAAKGQIVASAFLGIELQCARCHDSPYHSTTQRDLYSLAAMFERKPVTVPATSRVPAAFFAKKQRESLIRATLKPDERIAAAWPFAAVTGSADDAQLSDLLHRGDDTRERLAALITAPRNTRFARVTVNRVWQRLMGAGLVEPVHDWEGHAASHPELLDWLAKEFVTHDYDLKHVARLILTSQTYQRTATGKNLGISPDLRFFVAPEPRRLSAEQIVDSLYVAAGQRMDIEQLTFDPDGRRAASSRANLGPARRAWMLASLANERDRPSLTLPRARAVTDILEAFGWSGSRQNPRTERETAANVLQPGVLANSTAAVWLTRAAENSGLAETAIRATSPEQLVDSVFLRYLSRLPRSIERQPLAEALAIGFEKRLVPAAENEASPPLPPLPRVTWSNHLQSEANTIGVELERRARLGPPPDSRLSSEWRELLEDVVWSVVNIREFVWMP